MKISFDDSEMEKFDRDNFANPQLVAPYAKLIFNHLRNIEEVNLPKAGTMLKV